MTNPFPYIDAMTFRAASQTSRGRHVAIAGAGAIGLSCAFELARRGARVTLFDPGDVTRSTSWAAAGMIAPAYEVMLHGGDIGDALSDLCFASAGLWAEFASDIQTASGLPVGFDRHATLAIARTGEQAERLERLHHGLQAAGHLVGRLAAAELHKNHGVAAAHGGLALHTDHQVDNRRLLSALKSAFLKSGGAIVRQSVSSRADIEAVAGEVDGLVWARGIREFGVSKLVKGQALALYPVARGPDRVIRYGGGYIVPKADRIVIGATSEPDFDFEGVSAKATDALLADARAVCPALAGAQVSERWSGLRPLAATGLPIIGRTAARDTEFVAAAHYRNGILLSPVTAKRIADMVEGHNVPGDWAAFEPEPQEAATA